MGVCYNFTGDGIINRNTSLQEEEEVTDEEIESLIREFEEPSEKEEEKETTLFDKIEEALFLIIGIIVPIIVLIMWFIY